MNSNYRYIVVLLIFLLCAWSASAQKKYSIKSRKAIHYYETAGQFYRERNSEQALNYLNKALEVNSNFIEAYLFKADVLNTMGKNQLEIDAYKKAIAIDATYFPRVHFNLANAYLKIGEYQKALKEYKDFLSFPNISLRNKAKANKNSKKCQFALLMIENPVDFEPVNLGDAINTDMDEYWPSLSADERMIVFTRLCPRSGGKELKVKKQEDFWISSREMKTWRPAVSLSESINTDNNEGAQSITADGRMMYFTACNRSDGMGRCDIYYSEKIGDKWSKPKNLGKPVNSAAWDAQPSISADGRILYFVSNRKSGKGKMDIWKSRLMEVLPDGQQRWSNPVNLSLNTRDNEMSPFIHASNQYLVFASDGRMGMGGFDLFKATKQASGIWTKPENLGYPINTYGDEIGLVINARSNKAYFSSDRLPGKGKDIFVFDLPERLQPPKASWLKGKVFDAATKKNLRASLSLIDLNSRDTVAHLFSDRINGNYLICLPAGKEYLFAANCDNYLFYSDHFSLQTNQVLPQILNVPLQKLKTGSEIVLRNVFYATDSWQILPKSETELKSLLQLLTENTDLKVQISGHTDNTGSEQHNLKLSENRAKSVCDYLVKNGISASRLSYQGYGSSKPISDNESASGKAQNRRTEFKIVE